MAPPTSEQPAVPQVQQPPPEQHGQRGAASDAETDNDARREAPPAVEAERQQEPANGLSQAEGNQDAVRDTAPRASWTALIPDLKFTELLATTAAAFAVIVAYLQVRVARTQAEIMRRQADIAEHTLRETAVAAAAAKVGADAALRGIETSYKSFVSTQRAFVHVEPLFGLVVDGEKALQGAFLQPIWTNRGLTPAKNVTAWAVFGLRPTPLRDTRDLAGHMGDDELVISDLGPSAQGKSPILPVTLAQIQSAMDETEFAYIWGGADYDDVFEGTPRRTTRFCLRLMKGNDRPDIPFTLTTVTDFNYAT